MKSIIKQYYLIPFIGFLVLFSLKGFSLKSPNTFLENALIVTGGALLLSVIVGTIYYFVDTKWGPSKRKKKLLKPPFSDLLAAGFQIKEDFILGSIEGYTVIVMYTWPEGKSAIQVDVLFDPRISDDFISMEDVDRIEKRNKKPGVWANNNFNWTRNSIGHVMEYTFKAPSHQKILDKSKEMTGILMKEGLVPISYEKNEEIMQKLEAAAETEKKERK